MNKYEIVDSLVSRFVLDVCGAVGATWGTLEVFTIRTNDNQEICRISALVMGSLFFVRFIYQHYNYYKKLA